MGVMVNKKLLYLEDDEALANMTQRALNSRGWDVDHANSIAKAIECYQTKQYTHALLDMKLDDGNALHMISQLANAQPQLKIVLLTGYASIATAVQAIKQGALNYLPKPATIEEILSAFEETEVAYESVEEDRMSLKRLEWEKIQQTLIDNDGNISVTAKQLNMHRRTLQRKLNKRPVKI